MKVTFSKQCLIHCLLYINIAILHIIVDFFFLTPQLSSKQLRPFPLTERSHSALWKGIASNTIEKVGICVYFILMWI